jgi:uncharacterized coiled-coil DUF342 family protein
MKELVERMDELKDLLPRLVAEINGLDARRQEVHEEALRVSGAVREFERLKADLDKPAGK